jgi:ribulose-5-phosphate 4-epimerase/fuculose-1-phosphate aldolase
MAPPPATYGGMTITTSTTTTRPSNGGSDTTLSPDESQPSAAQHGAKVHVQKYPSPPRFTDKYEEREYLKGRLALAFRLFGKYGFDDGIAGHITLRDPVEPTTFWVNPFGLSFNEIRRSDLIHVDHEGNVIGGGPNRLLNLAAYMIHVAIHAARPDVLCAAHSHSIHGRTFCTLGRSLDITTQDSCMFYNDLALYDSFKGVVLAKEEGENIARALGDKKAALLQNHGLLTVGQTIEATIFWFVSLEKSCYTQLFADAAAAGRGGQTVKIADEDALFTYRAVGTPRYGWFAAQPAFDTMACQLGDEYLQ